MCGANLDIFALFQSHAGLDAHALKRARARAHTHTAALPPLITCPQPRHPRRRVSAVRVARPQLPVAVGAPAVDAAARQQRARLVGTRGEGDGACPERREGRRGVCIHEFGVLTGEMGQMLRSATAVMDHILSHYIRGFLKRI